MCGGYPTGTGTGEAQKLDALIALLNRPYGNLTGGERKQIADEITALRARLEEVERDRNEWRDLAVSYITQKSEAKARAERAQAALATARRDALPDCIKERTFAVQYSPNCPSRWLVRLPGESGTIDLRPYSNFTPKDKFTGDILGFGKTFEEAAIRALANEAETSARGMP